MAKTTEERAETAERLSEIKQEIKDLLAEARAALEGIGAYDRAHSYWLAHIACALDDDHMYVARNMVTMQSTIDELLNDEADNEW